MKYTYKTADGKLENYKDNKRYLFPLVLAINFAAPFLVMWAYWATDQNQLWVISLPFYFFIVIPVLDIVMGEDTQNPPDEIYPELSDDTYYRVILWLNVPMFYVIYISGIWFLMTQGLPFWAQAVFALGIGLVNGNVNTIAHESLPSWKIGGWYSMNGAVRRAHSVRFPAFDVTGHSVRYSLLGLR